MKTFGAINSPTEMDVTVPDPAGAGVQSRGGFDFPGGQSETPNQSELPPLPTLAGPAADAPAWPSLDADAGRTIPFKMDQK